MVRRSAVQFSFPMELSIYSLFKVDIRNLALSKLILSKQFNLSAGDIGNMVYWEYEIMRDEAFKQLEREKEEQEKQQKEYNTSSFGSTLRDIQRSMKTPSTNIRPPKL